MNAAGKNIIGKQLIEVIAHGQVDGLALQKETESLCHEQLLPGLEKLLDRYAASARVLQIDRLLVEVNDLSADRYYEVFNQRILEALESELNRHIEQTPEPGPQDTSRSMDLLIFYLDKGFLPWWSTVKDMSQWQLVLKDLLSQGDPAGWESFREVLKQDHSRRRLLNFLSSGQFWSLIDRWTNSEDLQVVSAYLSEKLPHIDQLFKLALLKNIAAGPDRRPSGELFFAILKADLKPFSKNIFADLDKARDADVALNAFLTNIARAAAEKFPDFPIRSDSGKSDTQWIYLDNAGLVIVAAFLPAFFKRLDLLSDESKILDADRAVSLLHYLASGIDEFAEFEIVLPKILCGISLSDVIEKHALTEPDKADARELLGSIIEHWAVLKNTSVEGLQSSFLRREGRLVFSENEWNLTVKQESYDMLLAHLPWNISLLKLPWMPHLLRTEWI